MSAMATNVFIHGTYLVGNRIKDRAQLHATRFEQFNVLYVMAGPDWKAADFDGPEDDVIGRLALKHSYPPGNSGNALVPELISRAHQQGVRVLVSVPGSENFNPVVADARKRALFARVMAAFVRKYDYDGIDIDWEHTVDKARHAELMADLRRALIASAAKDSSPPRAHLLTTALQIYRTYTAE